MSAIHDGIERWLAAREADAVAFLAELVKVPSDTPPGDNAPHARRAAKLLDLMGLESERHEVPKSDVADAGLKSITNLVVRHRFGPGPDLVVATVLLAALVAITVIDLRLQIIPDAITLPGTLPGLVANVATQRLSLVDSLLGIALGGGIFLVIILVSRGGMGGGDMKLGGMLGAFLGWKVALLALFIAVLLGGTFAIVLLLSGARGRKDAVPFGPFLALGGAIGLFAGEGLLTWYLSAFGG